MSARPGESLAIWWADNTGSGCCTPLQLGPKLTRPRSALDRSYADCRCAMIEKVHTVKRGSGMRQGQVLCYLVLCGGLSCTQITKFSSFFIADDRQQNGDGSIPMEDAGIRPVDSGLFDGSRGLDSSWWVDDSSMSFDGGQVIPSADAAGVLDGAMPIDACLPGALGCPCRLDGDHTCYLYGVCQNGVCVDPTPDCGDGRVLGLEECDDSNRRPGDGCGPTCAFETMCLLNHEGGNPTGLRSVAVGVDGALLPVDRLELEGSHFPYEYNHMRETIARCGRFVYLIQSDSDRIAGAQVAVDGTLTELVGMPAVENAAALLCDETARLLFAFSASTSVTVTSFAVGTNGSLARLSSLLLIYPFTIRQLHMTRHPLLPQFYVVATPMSSPMDRTAMHGSRVTYDGEGTLEMAQHPVEMMGDYFSGVAVSPEGRFLGLPGYSGGCFAWYVLDVYGTLPASSMLRSVCQPWDNGYELAPVREGIFYYTQSSCATGVCEPVIRVGAFGSTTLEDHGTVAAPGNLSLMEVFYDESVLVAASTSNGAIHSYAISEDRLSLTLRDRRSTGASTYFQAATQIACPLAETASR